MEGEQTVGQDQKNTQEPDMNQLRKVRREKLAELQQNGRDPFQITKFNQTHHSLEVKDLYEAHEAEILKDHQQPNVEGMDEEQAKEVLKKDYEERRSIMDANPIHVAIAGRMMFKRVMGKASFCNIQDLQGSIQVYVARDAIGTESYADFKRSDIGDIFGLEGFAFRTRTGEISIHAEKMTLLSKSLQILPEKFHGLTDTDTRYRQRYVDLIMNPESKETFIKRSQILKEIRNFLDGRGFMEVETPMLVSNAGGAAARPDPPASGDHRYAAHLQQPALHRQGAKDHRSGAGRQHGGAVSAHVHGKNERRQAALRRRHRSAVGCRAQIPAVCPMEYMDLYQRTLPCREYQATTNATDATLYSFCLDRTQTRPLPTTPLTFQQVTEYDYLVYSQEALDHAKKFTADIRKHYGVTAK